MSRSWRTRVEADEARDADDARLREADDVAHGDVEHDAERERGLGVPVPERLQKTAR
jgi:hypothetical protein